MMKRFITGLLILIVGIGGVFATNPDAVSFQVPLTQARSM